MILDILQLKGFHAGVCQGSSTDSVNNVTSVPLVMTRMLAPLAIVPKSGRHHFDGLTIRTDLKILEEWQENDTFMMSIDKGTTGCGQRDVSGGS